MNYTVQQLPFFVTYCASEQPGYESKLLEHVFRENRGWKSQKFPLYPIEMII